MAAVNVWTLVYRTDQQGNPLLGDLLQLRAAVLAGADVKVIYQSQPGAAWWSRACSSAAVAGSGAATIVSAVHMEAADTTVTPRGLAFAAPFAVEYHIYNSIGTRTMAKSVDGQVDAGPPEPLALKWFVKDYEIFPPGFSDHVLDQVSHLLP